MATPRRIPNQRSKAAPALASTGGLLHLVHLGDTSNTLWHSVFDGRTWTPNVPGSRPRRTNAPPTSAIAIVAWPTTSIRAPPTPKPDCASVIRPRTSAGTCASIAAGRAGVTHASSRPTITRVLVLTRCGRVTGWRKNKIPSWRVESEDGVGEASERTNGRVALRSPRAPPSRGFECGSERNRSPGSRRPHSPSQRGRQWSD